MFTGMQKHVFNILCNVLTVPVILFISAFLAVGVFMINFGYTEVLKEIASPDNKCYVEIAYVDQGALGGDMVVYAKKNPSNFPLAGHVFKLEKRLYIGDGSTENMCIEWLDDSTVKVNGIEHIVK